MTIKQQGGIFGRNPSFNKLEAEQVTVNGKVNIKSNRPQIFLHEQDRTDNNARIEVTGDLLRFAQVDDANSNVVPRVTLEMDTGNFTVNDGNLVIGTSGKGIDFSATSGTGTSELFSDYEEGTWSVTVATGSVTGATTAKYIKCGTSVTVWVEGVSFSDTTSAADITIGGLPFTAAQSGQGSIICSYVGASSPNTVNAGGTTVKLYSSFISGAFSAVQHSAFNSTANQLYFTVTYQST